MDEDETSVLETLGAEIIGVMSPVSITMLLVVLLITTLSSSPTANPSPTTQVTAATLVYIESPSDPTSQKLLGALLNAAAFVAIVAAVTLLLVLLYYYNFTCFLKNYTRVSAFFVLASMGGPILLSLLRRLSLPLDAPTALILLFNSSALGAAVVLSPAAPILLRQVYTVLIAVVVAAWFARLPEWTTWTLLLALALYDLVAVLTPRGPLKLLLDLASSRDEELPALIYEARPTAPTNSASLELQPLRQPPPPQIVRENPNSSSTCHPSSSSESAIVEIEVINDEETLPLVSNDSVMLPQQEQRSRRRGAHSSSSEQENEMFDTTRGIRLGLGDFVFYSVLVGRAAMYDLMTVYACYLAVISGLGCTLILLSVSRSALPALPISITLGVVFYFLTRLLMEPFVVGASTSLVMF